MIIVTNAKVLYNAREWQEFVVLLKESSKEFADLRLRVFKEIHS